jgi:hypothetical protein
MNARLHFLPVACHDNTRSPVLFPGKSPAQAGKFPAPAQVFDPYKMHRDFPEIWARYLREMHRGDVRQICRLFSVDERTVRSWLKAQNAPKGSVVAMAAIVHPEFFAALRVAA